VRGYTLLARVADKFATGETVHGHINRCRRSPSGRPLRRPADPYVRPAQSWLQSTEETYLESRELRRDAARDLARYASAAIRQSGARADRLTRVKLQPHHVSTGTRAALGALRRAVVAQPHSIVPAVHALTRILRVDAPSRDSSMRMVPSTTARTSPSTAAKAWERAVRQRVRCRPRLASVDDERSGVARVGVLDDHFRQPIDVQLREL
jgi:hypothetical protein